MPFFDIEDNFGYAAPMSPAQCVTAIMHQSPASIEQQFSCASQGYSGNAAWPIPQPVSGLQPLILEAINPPMAGVPVPSGTYEVANVSEIVRAQAVTGPTMMSEPSDAAVCYGVNDWIHDNPMVAMLIPVGIWLMRSK